MYVPINIILLNSNGIHQHVAIKEPSCPSYKGAMNGTITGLEDLARSDPRSSEYPGKNSNYEVD